MVMKSLVFLSLFVALSTFAAESMKDSPDLDQCEHRSNNRATTDVQLTSAHGTRPIQRTLAALEKSTAQNPARVRVLFYGQSIVGQQWHPLVMAELKRRYPTVIFEVQNRAIGGFTSPDLIRTAESDLYPYYPDLLFFHVYGPMDKYEGIIRKVRQVTTAEIVLWTSHLDRKESDSREKIEQAAREQNARSKAIFDIANRYGCMVIDLRKKWAKMMLDKGYTPDDLLTDGIHMKTSAAGFSSYAKFICEELVRMPGAVGDAGYCGEIESIPLTDSRIRRGADGSLSLTFSGNRVVAVANGRGCGKFGITLDGRNPREFSEMFYTTRPSTFVSWMPMVKHVDVADGVLPVEEDWTLTFIEGTKSLGKPVHYKVEGSVTGFDGEGWNTNDFRSISGRAKIAQSDFHTWQYGYFVKQLNHKDKDSAPGQTVKWSVKPLFVNPYDAQQSQNAHTVIVQNCANCQHQLLLKPLDGGDCGIDGFIVYRPAGK